MFNTLCEPNTVLWNSIIKAHVDSGCADSAYRLYKRMRVLGVPHDSFTFPILNQIVVSLDDSSTVWYESMIHCLAIKLGFESDMYFCNTLIKACVKCGRFCYARQLFDKMIYRDLVSWTSVISGYSVKGDVVGAFVLFGKMRLEVEPNFVTMVVMLQVCSILEGKQVHGYVIRKGFIRDWSVRNSVLKMYADCKGCVNDVEVLFGEVEERDVVSWNIMISYFCLRGNVREVCNCFLRMQHEVIPNIETLTLLISMFAVGGHIFQGRQIHCVAVKTGSFDIMLRTSLLDFYAKCGMMDASTQLFGEVPHRNMITWSAQMSGFIQNGYFREAIELFQQCLASGVEPVVDMLRSLVIAYSHMGALRLGKGIHCFFIRNLLYKDYEDTTSLETSILNMYIRCGSIAAAGICFDRIVDRDLVTWTSMIEGYGTHGLGHEALALFGTMLDKGIYPNRVTFLGLLSACSHSGLLTEGCEVFYFMKSKFGIQPDLNHYTCIIDLLGRCGKLKKALAIILKLVAFPDSRIWGALLSSCRVHEDQKLGKYAAQRLLELEPDNVGYYTLFSNIQANDERWGEVEEVRNLMKDKDFMKLPGWSCIEANGTTRGFIAGDKEEPEADEIYDILRCLGKNMQDERY